MNRTRALLLSITVLMVTIPAMAKRCEHVGVPFMPLLEAFNVAQEVLAHQKLEGLHCKGAENLVTNGGGCWTFKFVSEDKRTYEVEVYSGRRVRQGQLLQYPFSPEKEIQQIPSPESAEKEKARAQQPGGQ